MEEIEVDRSEEGRKITIHAFQKEMEFWYGFELTEEQVNEFLDSEYCSPNMPFDGIIDTDDRDRFGDFLANKICGANYWVTNGDPQEEKEKFFKDMRENAPRMGYKILF